jgi:N-acetylneuraminate synthase
MNTNKTFLIAEIGINHNGKIALAKKLIDIAQKTGFDAVKFQKRTPEITTPNEKKYDLRDTPWGKITYLDYKKKIEFGRKEFDEINRYCKKKKIEWFASPWDIESNNFLDKYKLKYSKIASPIIKNIKLIDHIASKKKYTFISTGMCEMDDIKRMVKIFKKKKCKFSLLHCVSTYPANDADLNLKMIETLRKKFKVDIGYSGHEKSVSTTLAAVCLGAKVVERHITLDRTMWGTDQAASLEERGMKSLVDQVRKFEIALGNGKKKFLDEEKKKLSENKYW